MSGQGIRSRLSPPAGTSGGGGGPPFPGTLDTVFYHTVSAPEAAAKQFNLPTVPPDTGKLVVDIHQGPPALLYNVDYTTIGLVFDWNGLGLDGLLAAGDTVRVIYNSV